MPVAAAVSGVVVFAVSGLRIPVPDGATARGPRVAFVFETKGKGGSEELLAEKLAAYDPRPLFVPGWMSSSGTVAENQTRRSDSGPFEGIPPELTKITPTRFPGSIRVPSDAAAGLALAGRSDTGLSMGRGGEAGMPLRKRRARVEAVDSGGREAFAMDLPADGDFPAGDWQPVEMAGAVGREGQLGELVIVAGSGVEKIDEYFRSQLRGNVRIGGRLPAGFYTFRVGP